jgi:lauroyl/myristoyl acyltransferase
LVRGFLTYVSYRLAGALAGPLPPRIGYGLSHLIGRLLYTLSPRFRRILTHNLSHVLGPDASEEELRAVVRQACVNNIKGHYDLFRLSRLSIEEIRALTRVEGQEHFDQVLARGQGVVLISAHFGNVDILGQLPLAYYGIPFTAHSGCEPATAHGCSRLTGRCLSCSGP